MNDKENGEDGVVKSTGSRFYATLVQLGVPGVVAAAILGAIYAALVALGVLSLPSCSVCGCAAGWWAALGGVCGAA